MIPLRTTSLLLALAAILPASFASGAEPDEASALAVLSSGADLHEKARACQVLGVVGGPDSIPALAALLDKEILSDYARSGLENIKDPSAGAALLTALPKLSGLQLAGAVNSLGVRRDVAAVPALQKLALDPKSGVREEAIASLGMIGNPAAAETIGAALTDGPPELRIPAAHAAFIAAGHLKDGGDPAAGKKLLEKVANAKISEQITAVAVRLDPGFGASPPPAAPESK